MKLIGGENRYRLCNGIASILSKMYQYFEHRFRMIYKTVDSPPNLLVFNKKNSTYYSMPPVLRLKTQLLSLCILYVCINSKIVFQRSSSLRQNLLFELPNRNYKNMYLLHYLVRENPFLAKIKNEVISSTK